MTGMDVGSFDASVALDELAARLPHTGAVVLQCPFMTLAVETGRRLGETVVPDSAGFDVHVASPEGQQWTLEEIDRDVVATVSLSALSRHIMVVGAVDDLTAQAADRLLKTIEEPAAPTLWLLCARDVGSLPATLRSRVVSVLDVHVSVPSALLDALAGFTLGADELAAALGSVLDLTEVLIGTDEFASLVDALATVQEDPSVLNAHYVSAQVASAAKATKLSTGDTRRLGFAFFEAATQIWLDTAVAAVRNGADPEGLNRLETSVAAARIALRTFAPLPAQLAAVAAVAANELA